MSTRGPVKAVRKEAEPEKLFIDSDAGVDDAQGKRSDQDLHNNLNSHYKKMWMTGTINPFGLQQA